MQVVDEKPETIHLYVVREEEPRPSLFPIVLSALSLVVLFAYCVLIPYRQPESEAVIRVPAVFLPLKTFTTTIRITPTGVRTIPATTAHGILTITNGSIISQILPKGMIIDGVILDESVFVPAGSANRYGYATVSAHALINGSNGNIRSLNINIVEGSSIYIRNLTSFSGGKDAYTLPLQLPQDRQTAVDSARLILATETAKIRTVLVYPCKESSQVKNAILLLSWTCQYVIYSIPSYMRVIHLKLVGKTFVVDVRFVARPITRFK